MITVQATWDTEWREIFSTSWEGKGYQFLVLRKNTLIQFYHFKLSTAGLPELPDPEPFGYLPLVYLIKMLIISPIEIALLLYLSWKVVSIIYYFSAVLGAYQWPSIGLMMLYLLVTFALAWRPAKNVFHIDLKENDKKYE